MPAALKDIAFALMGWVCTPLALGATWAVVRLWTRVRTARPRWRVVGRIAAVLLGLLATVLLAAGVYGLWVRYRPQPSALVRPLHPGIEYQRFSRRAPRPIVVHVTRVDLGTPGLEFVLTPVETGGCLSAKTTSSFLSDHDVDLAINTQFFYTCPDEPRAEGFAVGQRQRPVGVYAVGGTSVVRQPWLGNTIYIAADGSISLYDPPEVIHHAFTGRHRLVEDGRALQPDDSFVAPRLAVGFDQARTTMTFALVDGRQRGYSEGLRLSEMATLLVELGVHDAIELDGGGSATMVTRGDDGGPTVLNAPIHTRIPGRERPVANHLGIRVAR
ncbi:MAG: phosphodiester glycosidase family protein [Deltaproteobacteria bacterium]|nr:phosphodiester glycosidase family protein [Deltaproteobacteria bacterium]